MESSKSENKPDITALKKSLAKNYLHYDPKRVDYSVSDYELNSIERHTDSIWKDIMIASFGIGIPCIINAIIAIAKQETFSPNLEIFLNSLIGALGVIMGSISYYVWSKNKKNLEDIIKSIKSKPLHEL